MAGMCPRCNKPSDLSAQCTNCGYIFNVDALDEARSNVIDNRIMATQPSAHRMTTAIKASNDAKPERSLPCDEASCGDNFSPFRILAYGMGAAGIMALVGYFCGLAQGQGMEVVLALICGVLGGFVVFLGYGPVAFIIGFLGKLMDWLRKKR